MLLATSICMGNCSAQSGDVSRKKTPLGMSLAAPAEHTPSAGVLKEKYWLETNLKGVSSDHTVIQENSRGTPITEKSRRTTKFVATVDGANAWRLHLNVGMWMQLVYPSGRIDRGGSVLEDRECVIQYKKVPWHEAMVIPTNLRSDKRYVDGDYEYALWIYSDAISCGHNMGTAPGLGLSSFELIFYTREAAENARMALIKHADPVAFNALSIEQGWIDHSLSNRAVQLQLELDRPLGLVNLKETHRFRVRATKLITWQFISEHTLVREGRGQRSVELQNTWCNVNYQTVDWTKAKVGILPSTNPRALDKPKYSFLARINRYHALGTALMQRRLRKT